MDKHQLRSKKSADVLYKRYKNSAGYRSNKPLIQQSRGGLYSVRHSGAEPFSAGGQPRNFSIKETGSMFAKRNSEDHIKYHYKSGSALHRKKSPKVPSSGQYSTEVRSGRGIDSSYKKIKHEGHQFQQILSKLTSIVQDHTIDDVSYFIIYFRWNMLQIFELTSTHPYGKKCVDQLLNLNVNSDLCSNAR